MDDLGRFVAIQETVADHQDRILDFKAGIYFIQEGDRVHSLHVLFSGLFFHELHRLRTVMLCLGSNVLVVSGNQILD